MGWPPQLPIEIAMREIPLERIRDAYGLSIDEWHALWDTPRFVQEIAAAQSMLRADGGMFVTKARLQAESLLAKSWAMIHAPDDAVPPAVRADLIKFTIRAAGYDQSVIQRGGKVAPTFNVQINL